MSFCIGLPNFVKIELPSAELWRHIDFSRWRWAAILDLIWIILDHLRSAIVGLSLVLDFGHDRIYSFGDIAIFMFRRFGLKLPIQGHLGEGGLIAYFRQMTSLIALTPQKAFPHADVKIGFGSAVRHGHVAEKKGQDRTGQDSTTQSKKVTKW